MARRGRKRKPGPREPNGRVSRKKAEVIVRTEETERQTMATVIKARCKRFGLSEDRARLPMAGSAIGRMCLGGELTVDQHDAALRYLEARKDGLNAIMAKADGGGEGGSSGDVVTSGYAEWCKRANERWSTINRALDEMQESLRSPTPRAALEAIVVRDVDVPELVGDLRIALNVIDRCVVSDHRRVA